ncbi:hypothetical protein SHIRM173S_04630 [Streptomyces hirsutus]
MGFVEAGSTFGLLTRLIMSGAWPPPAPSMWKMCRLRYLASLVRRSFLVAAKVCCTKPDSFRESACRATWTPVSSHTVRAASITAGVAPQSSWILKPRAPAATWSSSAFSETVLPLASRPMFTG